MSRDIISLTLMCDLKQTETDITSAFRSSEVLRLLLDLDLFGGTDPLGIFSFDLSYENYWCSVPPS